MAEQNSFITNQDKFLSDIINGILPKSHAVDILVGYFYFSGYAAISDQIRDKQVRILVGLDVDTYIVKHIREIEYFDKQVSSRGQIRDEYYKQFVNLFNNTDFLDSESRLGSFRQFYEKVKDGSLEVRKTEDPCHAKMYLFSYKDELSEGGEVPGTVITGSSNLSYQGLHGRVEINARFNDKNSFQDGASIFNELWSNSVVLLSRDTIADFDEQVIKHVWYEKIHRPYILFLRVLKEYFAIPLNDSILTPYDITDGRYFNLKYQNDAIQMALNALNNHNGVIIADVVGLGKSIIASTVAKNLKLRTIIIAPPHLVNAWEGYCVDFKYAATVFSSGKMEDALLFYQEHQNDESQWLIIVDEAHRFRNEYTQDYAILHQLCSDNKVMLLSATPFNNRPDDIYAMVKLFQIPTKSTLKTVDNLGNAFRSLISKYKELSEAQRKKSIDTEQMNAEAEAIAKNIRSIIGPLVVRRSRLDLLAIPEYRKDLEQQHISLTIPEDPELLEYDLSQIRELYLRTLDLIDSSDKSDGKNRFKAARYSPILYVPKDKQAALKKELEEQTGVDFGMLVGRQTNLASFMRKLLVSRFESSVASFRQSLSYIISSTENILQWIDKVGKIPVFKKGQLPNVDDFYQESEMGMEVIDEVFEKYKERGFFEIDMQYIGINFVEDLKSDVSLLRAIQTEWFGVENVIRFDPKLDSFIKTVEHILKNDPQRKLIVFSTYADTVDYLGSSLKAKGLPVFKYTGNDATSANKNIIKTNFDAGLKPELQRDDYKILVATDAIAEGYNLHRAGAIFNYDIPYNPTHVIQRIGRINRVNKKVFDKLYIYNYFPTDVGESETRTKEISTLKMAMIHAIMGEDTKALTSDEEVRTYFVEQYHREFARSEENSWDTPYRKLLNEVKGTMDFDAALELPHRTRTGRKNQSATKGVLLFGKKGNDYIFKIATSPLETKSLSAEEALQLFQAPIDEPGFSTSEQFDTLYQQGKAALFANETTSQHDHERLKVLAKVKALLNNKNLPQDYLHDLIEAIKNDSLSGFELRMLNKLKPSEYSSLMQNISQAYLNRLTSAGSKADEGDEYFILSEELQ